MPEPKELPRESNEKKRQTVNIDGLEIDIYRLIPFIEGMETENVAVDSLAGFDQDAKYFMDGKLSPRDIIEEYQRTPDFDEIIKNHPEWQVEIERVINANYEEHPILLLNGDLLDGAHRITRALIDGVAEVKVKRLSKEYVKANYEQVKFLGQE